MNLMINLNVESRKKQAFKERFYPHFQNFRKKKLLTAMGYINSLVWQLCTKAGFKVFSKDKDGAYQVNRRELEKLRQQENIKFAFPTSFVENHCSKFNKDSSHSRGTLISIRDLFKELELINFEKGQMITGQKNPPIEVYDVKLDYLLIIFELLEEMIGTRYLTAKVPHCFYTTVLLFNHVFGLVKELLRKGKELILKTFNRKATDAIAVQVEQEVDIEINLALDVGYLYPDTIFPF